MLATTPFGHLPDGREVTLYELTNQSGMELRVLDYGGIVQAMRVPDRRGRIADVVLGFDELDGYLAQTAYIGAVIGRYGNRIGGARFELDGRSYSLPANDGPNHLHGGDCGFDRRLWQVILQEGARSPVLTLTYQSLDGEEGYPGTLTARVDYRLTDANEFVIDYRATTDRPTVINLTHHSYFNLAGEGDILDHEMWINADLFTPVGATLIPTGELRAVTGTPFDFRIPQRIGSRIEEPDEQLARAGGYDHNFVLRRPQAVEPPATNRGLQPILAARVQDPASGRLLEVSTTEPGLQFYSGNFLAVERRGRGGCSYGPRSGFCLETQHFPDSPNKPQFPTTVLRPGQQYRSRTVHRFRVSV